MLYLRTICLPALCSLSAIAGAAAADGDVVIQFDKVETGKATTNYTDQGVVFALSRQPTTSRAAGRVMFFPHLKTQRKGLLNWFQCLGRIALVECHIRKADQCPDDAPQDLLFPGQGQTLL